MNFKNKSSFLQLPFPLWPVSSLPEALASFFFFFETPLPNVYWNLFPVMSECKSIHILLYQTYHPQSTEFSQWHDLMAFWFSQGSTLNRSHRFDSSLSPYIHLTGCQVQNYFVPMLSFLSVTLNSGFHYHSSWLLHNSQVISLLSLSHCSNAIQSHFIRGS